MNDFLTIKEILDGYKQNKFSPPEIFELYLKRIEKQDGKLNAFITTLDQDALHQEIESLIKDGINPIPIAHKDIYSTIGIETTAASKILSGYLPPYDATSVKRLKKAGFSTVGKLNCDEFAHGATGENSAYGPTRNPYDLGRVPGGSSSGSAAAVAAGLVPAATATDTGGSTRFPASFTNTVGLKPTYGRVSRYGVIAMTSSTDSIGHITRTVWDNAYILNITAGHDPDDATSAQIPVDNYLDGLKDSLRGLRIGVPKEYLENIDQDIEQKFDDMTKLLSNNGVEISQISLPHTKYAINAYYIITPSEISSNLARFDGIRFGQRRDKFGEEAKRRIMLGTFCLSAGYYDQYYLKAQKVRTYIIEDFKRAFKSVDAIIAPVSAVMPPKIGELIEDPVKLYMLDALMVPTNLAGLPGLSVPAGFAQGLPVGIQIIGNYFQEKLLYQIGHTIERETEFYQQIPELKP